MSNLDQIALVLGMHRSGTSALAALISRLGFEIGKNLLPANEYNAHGYYENEKLVQFHDEILEQLGSSWHDLRFLRESSFQGGWLDNSAQKLFGILKQEFGDARRVVVKDPRACRLLPIWHRLARERDLDLRFILIGRHPLQVSYSLAHRDGFSRQKSLLLWLQYNLVAEHETRSGQCLILRYQDLMTRPNEKVHEVASFLEIASTQKFEEAAASIDSSFAHHVTETDLFCEQPDVQRWTAKVWQTLFLHKRVTEAAKKRLDHVEQEVRERVSIFPEEASGRGDYEAAIVKRSNAALKERYEEKNRALAEVARQRDEVRKEADATRQDLKFLKERYQERDQLLQAVMLHRDEVRKQAESAERESKALKERYAEQNQSLRDLMERQKALEKRNAVQTETLRDLVARNEKLQREFRILEAADEERKALAEILQRTAAEIEEREARRRVLDRQLETLRHNWMALPLRRDLKKLVPPFANSPPDLVQLNGTRPTLWNQHRAGSRFGASIFPDLERPGGCLIDGWILPEDKETPLPVLRLVSESGARRSAKGGQQRIDIPLLFQNEARAGQCGFALHDLKKFDGARCRLEVRKPSGQWTPLALIDLNGVGSHHIAEIDQIAASQLFDPAWYARRYRMTELSDLALISHYLREGAARGFFPNPLFDTAYYCRHAPELCTTGENPLLHYLHAAKEGRAPRPNEFFDSAWYLEQHKDVAAMKIDPLAHYLRFGKREGRNPGPEFDAAAYLRANPDVEQSSLDPLAHYLHFGFAEGRGAPKPGEEIRWVHETKTPSDDGKSNLLLVGHVLGEKVFGSERSLLELIQLIDRTRFNIYCSFPQARGALLETIKPFLAGVAIFPYKWWLGSETTDGYEEQFETLMRSRRIDLVHVNSIVLRDPLVAANRLGIPSVLHLREIITFDPDLAQRIGLPPEQIASEVNSRCDFVIANSHFTQAQQGRPDRSFVLYNTADEAAFDLPLREREGALRVGMLSSNLPKKGLEDFFKIAARAREQGDPLEFWLVGPETDWIRQHFAQNEGCPANVRCVGYVENPPDILREIDVIINLSTFAESFGRSVAEGMLARRPAVVYEYGALPELIRDGVEGFVVPYRDPEAARERLNRLARDPELLAQMGASARSRAVENFSRSVGAQTLNRIYETVLRGALLERANGSEPGGAGRPRTILPPEKRMRIGYFMWHFPVPSETFVLNELRDFVRLGHDVLVFCKESPHREFQPDFPIEWQRVKSPEELAVRIKETGRETMHSHFVFPTVTQFLWPACEIAGVPFTFIAHAVDIFREENAAKNRLGQVARSPMCRRVFAPGTFHRDFFIQHGVPEEKIIISPQGIRFEAYEAQPIAPRLQRPRMSVCAIHRFIEKKGLHEAIHAAKELASHGISLHLYGYGPLEQSCRELVAELGLENVYFPGSVKDRNHMISVFREHDLFLCPSIRAADGDMDGIPTILIEAMASHVPVIASRISSIPDLVVDGVTGYLCEPGDVESLTQSILRFYREPVAQVRAMIENAREHVRKHFDVMKSNRTLVRTWSGEGLDVILVTYNATAEVREVIERLYRYTKAPFQLYLVDNGSEPQTLEYLRSVEAGHGNVRLLPQAENLLVGPGTNKGIEAGRAPIAVYLCSREGYVISEGWDQAILDYMEDHPEVGLAGTLGYSPSYFTGSDYIEKLEPFSRFRNPEFAARNRERHFRHVQGGMFAIRRTVFESIGGFSEAVPHNYTDVEYSYYVESRGWQLGQIPDFVVVYQKSRPLLTARLDESVYAVHPGSSTLSPLLDKVVRLETNLCNVCGNTVEYSEDGKFICPLCGSMPFHRSLYRYLAESTLSYRQLVALHVGGSDWLLPDWKKMFRGRTIAYPGLVAEMEAKGRIDHPAARLDLVVLHLPDPLPNPPDDLLTEIARILKPDGTLIYFQLYGREPMLHPANNEPSNPDEITAMLESHSFQTESRPRYASAAVRYCVHEIFICRKSLAA